jgi:hypothetical protein
LPRDESGGFLFPGQVVPGIKVARARFRRWCGTWEPLATMLPLVKLKTAGDKGEPQAAETARGRVPMRGRGTDRLVVVVKPV